MVIPATMLGTAARPERISLAIPKERIDYTEVEDMFSKLATDDQQQRQGVVKEISRDILGLTKLESYTVGDLGTYRANEELHTVKLFLGTILRLAHRSPFPEVTKGMTALLDSLESLGLQVPRVRFRKGPSFYIPQDQVPRLDDELSEAYPIFKDAFMNDARVSNMVQLMGFHPKYTVHWVKTHHDLLRGNGPLPRDYSAYIGIMASARHHCLYTVNLLEQEFLCFGGKVEWLEGVHNAPRKLQNLLTVNNILCHRPWALTSEHISRLLQGSDSWSRPELTQALTILCHIQALTTFVLGCGLTHEIDSSAGHNYGRSGYSTPIKSLPDSPQIETGEADILADPENNGLPVLFDDIYSRLLQKDGESCSPPDTNHQIFTDLIEEQSNNGTRKRSNALAHYTRDDDMQYEVTTEYRDGYEFDWEEMGYPCCRNYDIELADNLSRKFKVIQKLTYKTMGVKENVDTSKLRNAVWYYVHRLWGVYYMDVDYSAIQDILPLGFRNFISDTATRPEIMTEKAFNNWGSKRGTGFTYSEKVHFCLIIMEARFQASYCYALKALN